MTNEIIAKVVTKNKFYKIKMKDIDDFDDFKKYLSRAIPSINHEKIKINYVDSIHQSYRGNINIYDHNSFSEFKQCKVQELSVTVELPDGVIWQQYRPTNNHGLFCANCKQQINGYRYKCVECSDFNLCIDCQKSVHKNHLMVLIVKPEDGKICDKAKLSVRFQRDHCLDNLEEYLKSVCRISSNNDRKEVETCPSVPVFKQKEWSLFGEKVDTTVVIRSDDPSCRECISFGIGQFGERGSVEILIERDIDRRFQQDIPDVEQEIDSTSIKHEISFEIGGPVGVVADNFEKASNESFNVVQEEFESVADAVIVPSEDEESDWVYVDLHELDDSPQISVPDNVESESLKESDDDDIYYEAESSEYMEIPFVSDDESAFEIIEPRCYIKNWMGFN